MADDNQDGPIIGGGGNTSGTGGPDIGGAGEGAGAAGGGGVDQGELQTEGRTSRGNQASDGEGRESFSSGDDSFDEAVGGDSGISGSSGEVASSGRNSSEGNTPTSTAPDPGDPGGMGGVRVQSRNALGRPPGGVSPIDPQESSQD